MHLRHEPQRDQQLPYASGAYWLEAPNLVHATLRDFLLILISSALLTLVNYSNMIFGFSPFLLSISFWNLV